jgi:hypothetical protein
MIAYLEKLPPFFLPTLQPPASKKPPKPSRTTQREPGQLPPLPRRPHGGDQGILFANRLIKLLNPAGPIHILLLLLGLEKVPEGTELPLQHGEPAAGFAMLAHDLGDAPLHAVWRGHVASLVLEEGGVEAAREVVDARFLRADLPSELAGVGACVRLGEGCLVDQ